MSAAPAVVVRDVTLRDGLQDEDPISTEGKLALYEALVASGITELELTSFVRPDRVPALADAEQLARATSEAPAVRRWGLVLNQRGAERALAAGLTDLQFVVSVSESHNLENAGRTVEASLEQLQAIVDVASSAGASTEVTLATAFGCPYEGPVEPDAVVDAARRCIDSGASGLGLADTIGTAVPPEVSSLVGLVRPIAGDHPLGIHLHDTRGLAIANFLAALDAGVDRVDGSVGGLGGCPFAPGASGNVPLEDLVHALDGMGIHTGIDLQGLLTAAGLACELTGRTVSSHVGVAGPRFAERATRSTG